MRVILSFFLLFLPGLPLNAQQAINLRSDSLNFSIQLRYLFISYGAGVEFPIRQHSFGFQLGQNFLPPQGNWYLDFNKITVFAGEYKRYFPPKAASNKQFWLGGNLLFKQTDYGSPEEADWEGNWYKSKSVNIGPLMGWKFYRGPRLYTELFAGLHVGWQWGDLRWDNRDPVTRRRNPTYENADKWVWGTRLGASLGWHPFKKKRKF